MKAGTFTEEQIVALLQDAQKGEKSVEELCRDIGCSTASFYLWKKRYGDASVAEAKRLRRLERQNDQLLKLWVSSVWRSRACGRSWQKAVTASERREAAQSLIKNGIRVHRACELLFLSRSSLAYQVHPRHDDTLPVRIKALALRYPRWGCRRLHAALAREGVVVNRKTVHGIWKREGLAFPTWRLRRNIRTGQHLPLQAEHPNHIWTYDFIFDQTGQGTLLKILTLTDEFTRRSLAIRCGTLFTSMDVNAVLKAAFKTNGVSTILRSDNGPEFSAHDSSDWLTEQGVIRKQIDPGKP